ncbi:MAG: Na+/H+ antiporter NhaC family protein [Clostridia bacterium]|nr:Na+/H+ antiporter NhaC family protein [Clostridia bacterium]MBR2327631.1 Na+/H+ antiporter NhaC family protein [Clostridia bacterium]
MVGTFWAFVPAIVAIVLALVSKQVYVSLFIGILTGALMYTGGNPLQALGTLYTAMSDAIGGNAPILVFLVVLGIFVILMQKSGGSRAYGDWARKKISSKSGALAATAGLGCLIFVDDYFNCLTVGSVMRPVTDKFKVSHSKLAWIIDSTAAPICIIAPISSWAAAVSGQLDGNGFTVFIQTIPFNVYAILTIIMVFAFCFLKLDFGKMKKNELIAESTGDLNAGETDLPTDEDTSIISNPNGKVRHLIIPVIILIACCVGGMIYSGFFYDWETYTYGTAVQSANVIEAFANCDAGTSLAIGSTVALVLVMIYYMATKTISFKEITDSFTQGFKTMVPAILILTFAWTISSIMGAKGGYLDAKAFVEANMAAIPATVTAFFPAIFFVLACGIAFATGTSWGTFGVLVPVAVAILGGSGTQVFLTVSATLGGAVFGDHVSPISDTTILSSTGGNCNHLDHVRTQLPYAGLIAGIAFVSYIVAGFMTSFGSLVTCLVMWAVALAIFAAVVIIMKVKKK